jgi:hypothetical protein
MERSEIVFETCEVAGKSFDMTELDGKWTTINMETGEMYVGHNNRGDMDGKVCDVFYEMEWE